MNLTSLRTLLFAAALPLGLAEATAADRAWTGNAAGATDPNWSNAANWDTAAPVNGDNLIFSGYNQLANNNDLTALALGWLRFDVGGYVLTGNALSLSSGILSSTGDNAVGLALTLEASQSFESASGSTLQLTNSVTLGANILTFGGDGNATLAGVASGAGYAVKNGTGTLNITAKPTFTGPFIINGGRVEVNTTTYERAFVNSTNIIVNTGATLGLNIVNILYQSGVYSTITVNGGTVDLNGSHNHFGPLFLNGGTLNGISATGRYANEYSTFDFDVVVGGAAQSLITGMDPTGGYALVSATRKFTVAATGDPSGTDLLVNNPLVGGGLVKDGAGKLALAGVNTYAGATLVSGGTLAVRDGGLILNSPTVTVSTNGVFDVTSVWMPYSISTNQTLAGTGKVVGTVGDDNAGAAIAPGGNSAVGTLAMESLNLSGNLALNFDLANVTTVGGGVNDLLIVTNLNLSGFATNTVNFNFLNGTPAVGTYTLIQYSSGPAAGPVSTLAATASRYVYTFTSDGSAIKVTVTGNPAPLVWRGDGSTNAWDIATSTNWMNGATKDVFLQGDNATFNDSGSNTPPVNLAANLTPTVVTVNATKDYTLAGAGKLTGGARLVKSGSGTLTVTTENDFTGGTVVNAGTLAIGAGGTTGNLAGGAGTNNARIVINRTGTMISGASLAGTGSLALINNGTVNLSGTNTFTGGTLVNNGSLQIGNTPPVAGSSIAGPITNYSAVYFGRSDAFMLASPITSAGNDFLNGPGQVYLRTPAGMTVDGTAGIDIAGNLNVSQDTYGRLAIAPGASINLGGELLVGNPGNIGGDVVQTGGTVNVTNRVRLSHWSGRVCSYLMSGGTLNVANALNVGWDGVGVFSLDGGTVNCLSMAVDGNGNTGVVGTTNETFAITGGRINIGSGGITTVSTDGGYRVLLGGGTVGASANWASSLAMILTNGPGVTFDTAENTITLTGQISGTNGLTKTGSGYLNLNNGANPFSGPVSVAQGTLQGSGTVSGPVTVQSGGALSAGTTAATGTLTVSNAASFTSGARLVIDAASTAATSDRVDVRGALSLDPAGTPVYFNFLGGRPFTGGAYTIVSNLLPRTGTLAIVNPTRYAAALDETDPNRIQVSFTGTDATLVWKGNVNNLWNVNGTANWLDGTTPSTFYQSDAVVFDGTGLGTPNVSLAAEVSPAAVTVSAAGDYTFSGAAITGSGALTKSGSGKLTLANDNTFTGGTAVGTGTLQIGNGGATGSLVGNIANNSAVVFNRSVPSTFAGVLSGIGTLTQAGAGKLTLAANNTFTGGTWVNPGTTVQIGAGLNAGSAGVGPIQVQTGGSLVFFRNDGPAFANPISGGGAITFKGPGSTSAGSSQGSFTLTGSNTFSGTVTLDQARLSPGNAYALGSVSSYVVPVNSTVWPNIAGAVFTPSLTLSGAGWPEAGGYLGALRLSAGVNWAGPITLSGNTRISSMTDANDNRITGRISGGSFEADFGAPGGGTGVLTLAPGSPNTFGALRVSPGILIAGNANALPASLPLTMNGGTLRLNGNHLTATSFMSLAGGIIQNGSTNVPCTITLNVNDQVTYGGTFVDFGPLPLAVVKNGSGTLTLTAISTALGGVTVNGGVLALNNGGANGTVKGTLTANPGATILSLNNDSLGYNGGNNQVTNLVLNGASLIHTPNNNLTLWNNAVVTLVGGYLAATNTSGAARLDFGAGASLTTLASPASSVIYGVGAASAPGSGTGIYLRQADTVFTVADGAAANDLVINAPINQAAAGYGITKRGAGRLALNGPVGFTGALTVDAGSVVLSANSSLSGVTGAITLGSGASLDASAVSGLALNGSQVLQGSGTLVGNVTDNFGSIIRPGSSAGTLTINGNLALGGYGTLEFELANVTTVGSGVNDLLQVNGDLSLNDFAPTVVNFTFLNGAPAAGNYTLIKYTGTLSGSVPAGITNALGYIATFTHNAGAKAIQVSFTAPAATLTWEGDGGANAWDLATTSLTWFNGSANTNFYQADSVRFDDTRTTANTTVGITEAVKPAAITLDSTNNYTFNGAGRISGVTTLTKNNLNTVTLGTPNDFKGSVLVNAGVLASANATGLPDGAVVTVAEGAAFVYAANPGSVNRGYSFTIAGSGPDGNGALQNNAGADIFGNSSLSNLTLSGPASIGGANRWDVGSGGANVSLQGNGYTLTKVSANQITFRPETISGLSNLVINAGILQHENFNRTNASTAATTNIVNPTATLSSYGTLTFNYPALFNGGSFANGNGTATWIGPMTLAADTPVTAANPVNLFGAIGGPAALQKIGPAVLTLSNANTYAGGTILSNGPVSLNGNAAAGNASLIVARPTALGTGPVNLDGGLITANTVTNTFRALEFNLGSGATVANNLILPTALIGNVSLQGRDASSVFTLAGQISGGHPGLTNWLDNGTGNVGVIRLSNPANDFTAPRIRLHRGTLALTTDALGAAGNELWISTNATLRFDAPGMTVAHNLYTGPNAQNLAILELLGDNDGDGVPETVNPATLSGVLSGAGVIYPRGTNGTLTLTGNNTLTGGFELQQPVTLQVAASANLGTSAYVGLKANSTLRYTGTGSETMTRNIWDDSATLPGGTVDIPSATAVLTWNPGGGGVNQPFTKTGAGTLVFASGTAVFTGGIITANGGALTINTVISGGSTLVQVNTGTLTLGGANSYSGATRVNGGTLVLNGSTAAGSAVTVASGGTLIGNGTVNGPTTVQPGGVLSPGVGGVGKLTLANALTLAGSTVMELDKAASTNDAIASINAINYGGSLVVNNLAGTLAAGDTFRLFAAWAYFGSFSSMTLPTLDAGLSWDTSGLLVDGTIKVASLAPPALAGAVVLPDGNFQITLTGSVGQGYKILASSDVAAPLSTWTVLETGTLPSTTYQYTDLTATNYPVRFYVTSTP
jgi:fibronectin-binding autotransporter adhesin